MTMWVVILLVTMIASFIAMFYVGNRVGKFEVIKKISYNGEKYNFNAGNFVVLFVFVILWLAMNMMNAVVCLLYFAMSWFICDVVFWIVVKIRKKCFGKYYAGGVAVIMACFALCLGWYNNHTVAETKYEIETTKDVPNLRVAFFADSHIGTTFDSLGFAKHLEKIKATEPDVIFIVGDYIDDDTSREDMIKSTKALKNLQVPLGVYFVFGNHDKGYYGAEHRGFSAGDLKENLQANNVTILQDEIAQINEDFYVVGRQDSSEKMRGGSRSEIKDLVAQLDKDKFAIVLDHQPNDYEAEKNAEVDLVLSGHTHGGQLWPLNKVGEWIGANDKTYGYEKRENTNFIVTSGISDWSIKFKTGTRSEFVVVDIKTKE